MSGMVMRSEWCYVHFIHNATKCDDGTMKIPKKPGKRGWGEGSIDPLPSGKFRARGSVVGPDGSRDRVSRVFESLDAARSWLASLRVEKDKGTVVASSPLTLAQWAAEWLAGKKGSTGAGNYRNYDDDFRLHILPHLGAVRLRDLSAAKLRKWLADLGTAGTSLARQRKASVSLGVCLNDAVREGRLATNPLKKVAKPKAERKPVETWTADELRRFLEAARPAPLFPALLLLADAGCRPGEALGLHWPDVDLDRGTVRIRYALEEVAGVKRLKEPKTAAGRRVVSVSAVTVAGLRTLRERERGEERDTGSGPVFSPPGGGFYGKDGFRAAFQRAMKAAKVPKRKPYALRHTSATLLLAAGVNVRTVSRRLGHEDIAVTLRHYAGFMPDADGQAAEVMGGILGGSGQTGGKGRDSTERT
jgi:integrase